MATTTPPTAAPTGGDTPASKEASTLATRLHGFTAPTVWQEFSPLAAEHDAVNLGQGFPDATLPFVTDALLRAATSCHHQYLPPRGAPPLVERLAARYSARLGRPLDSSNVLVTVGASQGLFVSFQSLVDPGDEVMSFAPWFDLYNAQVKVCGGVIKAVPLRLQATAGDDSKQSFGFDIVEFEAALSPRTKVLILNTPHNPTGKVFTTDELAAMAVVLERFPRVIVVSDEVYEHLTYDDAKHVSMASIPGMFERTIVLGSAGKTFSVTGWKVGWLVSGAKHLVQGAMVALQWANFSVCTPVQFAVAELLEKADAPFEGHDTYYDWLRAQYARKRTLMLDALHAAGFEPIAPQGSFFILADTRRMDVPAEFLHTPTPACPDMTRDWAVCRYLTIKHGVAAIPPSAFYAAEHKPLAVNLARFAFCKEDSVLQEAARRLRGALSAPSDGGPV